MGKAEDLYVPSGAAQGSLALLDKFAANTLRVLQPTDDGVTPSDLWRRNFIGARL